MLLVLVGLDAEIGDKTRQCLSTAAGRVWCGRERRYFCIVVKRKANFTWILMQTHKSVRVPSKSSWSLANLSVNQG